jgi:hypothetical protein
MPVAPCTRLDDQRRGFGVVLIEMLLERLRAARGKSRADSPFPRAASRDSARLLVITSGA